MEGKEHGEDYLIWMIITLLTLMTQTIVVVRYEYRSLFGLFFGFLIK